MSKETYCEDIFLDSGAWALCRLHVLKQGKKAERMGKHGRLLDEPFIRGGQGDFSYYDLKQGSPFRKYCDSYASFVHKFKDQLELFANIDAIGSPQITWDIQRFFEEEHGLRLVPVIHHGSELKWVERYIAHGYDIVGLGGYARKIARDELIRWTDEVFIHICPKSNDYKPIIRVHGFALTAWEYMIRWPWYCMTDEHEVLTRDGWKGRMELQIGDTILAYKGGKSQWEQVTRIPVFEMENEPLYHFDNRNFHAEVTSDHRWLVYDRYGKDHWVTSPELASSKKDLRIPRRAQYVQAPTQKQHSDELVELIAWLWTDGSLKKQKGRTPSIVIYQSEKSNPEKVKSIRNLLERTKGNWNESRCKSHPGMVQFELRGDVAEKATHLVGPSKNLPLPFIQELTLTQLDLFLNTAVNGDGTDGRLVREKSFVFSQKKGKGLEAFRIAMILAGYSTSQYDSVSGSDMKHVRSSSVPWVYSRQLKTKQKKYNGKVWCVTVPSGAFFTRCKGHVYVTGNCVDSTSWVKYSAYGWIILPRWSETKKCFRYDRQPLVVNMSWRSPFKADRYKHLDNSMTSIKDNVMRWLQHTKVPLGEVDKEGNELVRGVVSSHESRSTANLHYFLNLQDTLPKWPWPLSPKIALRDGIKYKKGFGLIT